LFRRPSNILLVILDDLREDCLSIVPGPERRSATARNCISHAPWTLPSCTSLLSGMDPTRHGHYWQKSKPKVPIGLVGSLPSSCNKVGLVNNTALLPSSRLNEGFNKWTFTKDPEAPFEQAAATIRGAKRRKPLFLLVHSNIAHDYHRETSERFFREVHPDTAAACYLENRAITWNDTTPEEREAVARTYRACSVAVCDRASSLLALARERDDFVIAVIADHGEGLSYEGPRIHHGGRLHDDLIRVPFYFEVPSSIPRGIFDTIEEAFSTKLVGLTDIVPTLMNTAGFKNKPQTDGRDVSEISTGRVVVSEDRRYLYLRDRFRLNFSGNAKNMSDVEIERNTQMQMHWTRPPLLRSYRTLTHKLVVTCLQFEERSPAATADSLREIGRLLLGDPVVVVRDGALVALEMFDLENDPGEQTNLLQGEADWKSAVFMNGWADRVSLPCGTSTDEELALKDVVEGGKDLALA
jgi:arylsulfatase A-like enzyme